MTGYTVNDWEDIFGGKEESPPPYSNTGAANTTGSQDAEIKVSVDWLGLTFLLDEFDVEYVCMLFGFKLSDLTMYENGSMGYLKHGEYQGCHVYWYGGTEGMGVHVELTGQGCKWQEERVLRSRPEKWASVIEDYLDLGAKFTRLDVAVDEMSGLAEVAEVEGYLRRKHVASRWSKGRKLEDIPLHDDIKASHTLYIGSRKSGAMLRVYDKAAQQEQEGHWVRWELELKDEHALNFFLAVQHGMSWGDAWARTVRHYIRFLEPTTNQAGELHKNKSRWDTAEWFNQLLGTLESMQIAPQKPEVSMEDKLSWHDRQVAVSMAQADMYFTFGGDSKGRDVADFGEYVQRLRREGYTRLRQKHVDLVMKSV